MADTKIAWTDKSWNPVVGCTKVSSGCDNCYAEKMACRLAHMEVARFEENHDGPPPQPFMTGKYYDVTNHNLTGWNGRTICDESALDKPLHWRKLRRIVVCSMGDLFHESVPFEFIDKVMAVIALCPQHTFQILTKRPERMLLYFEDYLKRIAYISKAAKSLKLPCNDTIYTPDGGKGIHVFNVPIKNLWLGVTAENQEWWEKRKDDFFNTSAAVHFVSNEPLLGPIEYTEKDMKRLSWVILGAESGPKRRYCEPDWVQDIVVQCGVDKVPVFVKQIHYHPKRRKLIKDPPGWPRDYPKVK